MEKGSGGEMEVRRCFSDEEFCVRERFSEMTRCEHYQLISRLTTANGLVFRIQYLL